MSDVKPCAPLFTRCGYCGAGPGQAPGDDCPEKGEMKMADGWVKCARASAGWYCTRRGGHDGLCAGKPRWWNVRARLWAYMNGL